MPVVKSSDNFWFELARGEIPKYSTVHKFGLNEAVGTSYEVVTASATYQTPQYSAAVALQATSTEINDAVDGPGAKTLTLMGLDSTGAEVQETVDMNGTTGSAYTTQTFVRLLRAYVATTGTYATSQEGTISITDASANVWATIPFDTLGSGQTDIGCYTVPKGKRAWWKSGTVTCETGKSVSIKMMMRQDADKLASPYSSWRTVKRVVGIADKFAFDDEGAVGPFPAHTDLLTQAKVAAGTGNVSVDFELILEDVPE